MLLAALSLALTACTVTDGDTIRCDGERIRLTGIDAPESGACRPRGRRCVPGDPVAATEHLESVMARGDLSIVRLGFDRYGRTLALVYAGDENVACAQLAGEHAFYRKRWDEGGRVAADCPRLAETRRLANRRSSR